MTQGNSGKEPEGVEDIIGELDDLASKQKEVCIGDVLDDFGARSFGPVIMIFALLELTPVGAIPGFPTALAAIIALIALQMLFGKDHIWIPQFIQQRSVDSKKLHKGVTKLRGVAHWLDGHSKDRLSALTKGVWLKVAALAITVLCITVPPLEFLPFASSGPMLAIAAIGLALIVRDGLVMLFALALAVAALGGGTYYYYTSDDEEGGEGGGLAYIQPPAGESRLT